MKSNDLKNVPPGDDLLSAAIEWLFEREEGFSPERRKAFEAWCAESSRHAQAVAQAEQTIDLLADLPEVESELRSEEKNAVVEVFPRPARQGGRRWQWMAAALAAAAAVALSAVVWRSPAAKPSAPVSSYAAGHNQPQQVVLDDGSFVDLNANTSIRSQMFPDRRRIVMSSGEAHFAVAHDKSRPFVVEVRGIRVRAVGTAFDIKTDGDGVAVLVTEGRVSISPDEAGDLAPALKTPRELGVAERATFSKAEGALPAVAVEKVTDQEVDRVLAWQKAVTTFANRPLREIVALFNRRGPVHISIADPKIGERRIGGSFALSQPRTFIRMLELDGDLEADWQGKREVTLREGR